MLQWSEHVVGGALADAKYPSSRRDREKIAEHAEQRGKPWECHRTDDSGSGSIYGVTRKSAPDAEGNKPREVRFEERGRESRGVTPHLSAIMTIVSCDCDDTDIDMTYRMRRLTVGDSPSY